MQQTVHDFFSKAILTIAACFLYLLMQAQTAPELVFTNPVLKSGTANTEGAVYRFSNVTAGVDAELKLKKFSRNDLTMLDVDLASLGWDKALQPQFGLGGVVPPYQNWYIDFELSFFKAGQNKKQKMQKVTFTALDVDGDGQSVSEYADFSNASATTYSAGSALTGIATAVTFGSNGESVQDLTCPVCGEVSKVEDCKECKGTGVEEGEDCEDCNGSGKVFKSCKHPFNFSRLAQGPVMNFTNIDTAATQVMVTYDYLNKDKISFRYGAQSGSLASNGGGIRLNSVWGKQFSLAPWVILPVKFNSFSVMEKDADAVLNWEAARDGALSYFVIQRSTDGNAYTNVATVFAGTSAAYAYTDKKAASGTGVVYYRIVGVDQTKETSASAVRMVRLHKTEAASLAITTFPNPVVNDLRITLPAAWQGKAVMFEVYNANGSMAKATQAANANQTETLTLNNLMKGMYVVKATCNGQTAAQCIVKN